MPHLRSELIELERRFWTSGPEFYRQHLSQHCMMVVPGVGQMGRAAVIEGISVGARWSSVEFADLQLLGLNDDGALLVYDAVAERDSMEAPYRAHVSSVYCREDGGWKLAFHQQTLAG